MHNTDGIFNFLMLVVVGAGGFVALLSHAILRTWSRTKKPLCWLCAGWSVCLVGVSAVAAYRAGVGTQMWHTMPAVLVSLVACGVSIRGVVSELPQDTLVTMNCLVFAAYFGAFLLGYYSWLDDKSKLIVGWMLTAGTGGLMTLGFAGAVFLIAVLGQSSTQK